MYFKIKKFQFQNRRIEYQIIKFIFFIGMGILLFFVFLIKIETIGVCMKRNKMTFIPMGMYKKNVIEKRQKIDQHKDAKTYFSDI